MLVRDWMTKDPLAVEPHTPVLAAWRVMQDRQIHHLPVLEGRELRGLLTDRDLRLTLPSPVTALAAQEINYLLDKMPVADVMRKDVITTTPSTAITSAARLLLRHRLGAVPVLAGGILVGILSHSDVLQALLTGAEVGAVGRVA